MIDFHCHLDLYPDAARIADECIRRGLYVLSVTTTPSAWNGTNALSANAPCIRTALGLHPQLAHERKGELPLFDSLIHKVRYIGEIGLDGNPEFSRYSNEQVEVLEHVLNACRDAGGRIMSIHSRRASQAVIDRLEMYPGAGTPVLHWFSGNFRELDRAVRMGCWFSVGPAMLRSEKGKAIVIRIPRERVLTESDGPFAQIDGKSLWPWQVCEAVGQLSELWTTTREDVEKTLHDNMRNLVGTDKTL